VAAAAPPERVAENPRNRLKTSRPETDDVDVPVWGDLRAPVAIDGAGVCQCDDESGRGGSIVASAGCGDDDVLEGAGGAVTTLAALERREGVGVYVDQVLLDHVGRGRKLYCAHYWSWSYLLESVRSRRRRPR
jgi:hypothetical protein